MFSTISWEKLDKTAHSRNLPAHCSNDFAPNPFTPLISSREWILPSCSRSATKPAAVFLLRPQTFLKNITWCSPRKKRWWMHLLQKLNRCHIDVNTSHGHALSHYKGQCFWELLGIYRVLEYSNSIANQRISWNCMYYTWYIPIPRCFGSILTYSAIGSIRRRPMDTIVRNDKFLGRRNNLKDEES